MRTKEQLEEYFAKRRKAEAYKKWVEERKRIKAREAVKKQLKKKQKRLQQQQQTIIVEKTTISTTIGEFYEENLYTKEELMNIETLYPNETGRINWCFWNKTVERLRNEML